MSDIINKELKEKYDLYDKIISSCMVNFYSFSKDNDKIILRDFFSKSNTYLFAFEVAKLVNAIYPNKQIYIDMPFIQYIFFKIKNRKENIMLGEKIICGRKQCKLSQEDLAEKLGITRQTISNWELNETSSDLKQASKLCDRS